MNPKSSPKSNEAKEVGIWIRVSTEDQARGDSPEIHLERAKAYAVSRDWKVREIYDLAGVSGKSVMEHPECRRMMADIKRGHISGLIFSKLARLSRNLREVQDLGDFFRLQNADLISLNEAIDTSTAGGRMFFNLLGVFAQWEREEISERVNASFRTRAKMGRLLNKSCPYGYEVVDGKLTLHPEESPIRREAYELFLAHRRKHTVARILNGKGYRTRKNRLWQWAQIKSMLADSSAKGVHTFNKVKGSSWSKELKPESEWAQITCEPIVSETLWSQVNQILEEQSKAWKKPGRLPTQTFSKLAWCKCGGKMYARHDSPKYLCRSCNNKIPIADLEDIFRQELKGFFTNPTRISASLAQSAESLKSKEQLLQSHTASIHKIREEMKQTHRLYVEGQITPKGFGDFYKPAEERLNQLVSELPRLQADIDLIKVNQISVEDVMKEAHAAYDRWLSLPLDDRRKIAEAVCEKIVVGNDEIDITLSCAPSSEELCKNQTHLWARVS
jgi:site-specific DNA recombinase